MSESVEQLAALLLAAAIKEGRTEYINAIEHLVPAKQAIETLVRNPELFDESWKKRISRGSYSVDEINLLFSGELLKKETYLNFLVEMASNLTDKLTQYSFIQGMMSRGMYRQALRVADSAEDLTGFKNHMTGLSRYSLKAYGPYFSMIGKESDFSRDAAVLFDKLDIEIPEDFNGHYPKDEMQWSNSKFDASVDWVSELCKVSRVEIDDSGELLILNSSLIKAFKEERSRVADKGEWHKSVFPAFAPVIADPFAAKILSAQGYAKLVPEYGKVGMAEDGYTFISEPKHGFTTDNETSVSMEDVAKATTLISNEEITRIRSKITDESIFLIPADTKIKLDDSHVSDTLRIAMRYHRPEFLSKTYTGNLKKIGDCGISTRAYLRGANISSPHHENLIIYEGLMKNVAHLKAFSSPQEIAILKEIHNPESRNPIHAKIQQYPGKSIVEQAENGVEAYLSLVEIVGFPPATQFIGGEEFLSAVAAGVNAASAPVCNKNMVEIAGNPGRRAENEAQRRLQTRLGSLLNSPFKDIPYEELLVKGARLKNENDRWSLCGILDRISVVELANMARTPAQRKFVIENFDVQKHYKELPRAFRMDVGGKMLEDDLGM